MKTFTIFYNDLLEIRLQREFYRFAFYKKMYSIQLHCTDLSSLQRSLILGNTASLGENIFVDREFSPQINLCNGIWIDIYYIINILAEINHLKHV